MLISLTMVIILQCIHISKPHIVYLKYIQFLFVKNKQKSKQDQEKKQAPSFGYPVGIPQAEQETMVQALSKDRDLGTKTSAEAQTSKLKISDLRRAGPTSPLIL